MFKMKTFEDRKEERIAAGYKHTVIKPGLEVLRDVR